MSDVIILALELIKLLSTMEAKQRDTVYGYVRLNYEDGDMINDIIQIIYQYYLLVLDSVILIKRNDIDTFFNLLSPKLTAILDINGVEFKLLYRNSRDGNSGQAFHKCCDGHMNTVTLIHSEYGNVFGGFATKDWGGKTMWTKDDLAFLFRIKSKLGREPKIFNNKKKNTYALFVAPGYGPIWGNGHDLILQGGGNPYSMLGNAYEGAGNELCGGDRTRFEIGDYEVFAVVPQ